ncbi:hypothetical protein D3C77_520540 [compost metagenome]
MLDLLKGTQPPRPKLPSDTALLVAAPGRLREDHLRRIDPHQTGLKGIGHPLGGVQVATDDTGHQTEFAVVGQSHRFSFAGHRPDAQHRAKDFLTPQRTVQRHLGKNRRADEVSTRQRLWP